MKEMRFFVALVLSAVMFASCASHASERCFGPYSAAEGFYKKANYPKAIQKYQEYLSSNPQGNLAAIATYYIGKSYAASGDTAKARASFEQVEKKFPRTSWSEFAKEQLELLQPSAKS